MIQACFPPYNSHVKEHRRNLHKPLIMKAKKI